jgi:hypothetical protein
VLWGEGMNLPSPVPSITEPEFVNLLRSPGINSQPGGQVRQPYLTYLPARLHLFLGIDSWAPETFTKNTALIPNLETFKEPRARICRSCKETRYRFSGWRAGTKPYLSYWPARLHWLAKSIPRNRFLGSINVYKYGLRIVIDSASLCSLSPYLKTLKRARKSIPSLADRYDNPICGTGPPGNVG